MLLINSSQISSRMDEKMSDLSHKMSDSLRFITFSPLRKFINGRLLFSLLLFSSCSVVRGLVLNYFLVFCQRGNIVKRQERLLKNTICSYRFVLVLMESLAGSGFTYAARRLKLGDKLEQYRFDPRG